MAINLEQTGLADGKGPDDAFERVFLAMWPRIHATLTRLVGDADEAEAMIRKRPELKTSFMENLKTLQTELAELDAQMKTLAATKPGLPLLGSHPIYQYLAKRYGLNLKMVHWEANEMPGAAEWTGLQKLTANHSAHWMLWEAQPDTQIQQQLQAVGVASLVFEPCANRPESGDFIEAMKRNVENLKQAFR